LSGFVTDPSNKVVPSAAVVMTESATGAERTTVTNGSGLYALTVLPAGTYQLVVSAPGFRTETQKGIVLTVGQRTEINVHLLLGSVTEQVTVSAGGIHLDSASGSLGTTLESKSFLELPLLGRNPYTLVGLSPGVVVHGNPGSLGFNSAFVSAVKTQLFPRITTSDAASIGPDTTSDRHSHQENRQAFGSVTWVKGHNIFKAGADLEIFHNNTTAPFTPSGGCLRRGN
jgi:hypothetical protein